MAHGSIEETVLLAFAQRHPDFKIISGPSWHQETKMWRIVGGFPGGPMVVMQFVCTIHGVDAMIEKDDSSDAWAAWRCPECGRSNDRKHEGLDECDHCKCQVATGYDSCAHQLNVKWFRKVSEHEIPNHPDKD